MNIEFKNKHTPAMNEMERQTKKCPVRDKMLVEKTMPTNRKSRRDDIWGLMGVIINMLRTYGTPFFAGQFASTNIKSLTGLRQTYIIILIIAVCSLCISCNSPATHNAKEINPTEVEQENPYKDAEIKAVIIPSEDDTFGYDIYLYDAILIHQPSRPGLSGNLGFATAEDAMKVAELVIRKIRNNEMPPTVTIQELKGLEVL